MNHPDCIYKTEKEKFKAICDEIAKLYEDKRPVLVGTIDRKERTYKQYAKKSRCSASSPQCKVS